MTFKAVIFDLDGTLLDSLKGIGDAMNLLLDSMAYPTHPIDTYRYFVGDGIKELVQRALPGIWHDRFPPHQEKKKESETDRLIKEYRRIYRDVWPRETVPYPGIPSLLRQLTGERVKMGILSNKSDDFTKRMAAMLLADFSFEAVLGTRPGIPRKPAPDSALEISGVMKVKPGETLFVGDSDIDMQTAVNSGMHPVGVLWGFRDAGELRANGAKKLISHPADLAKMIKK